MKLDEPLTWREFFRGMTVSMAVGVAAAFVVLVPATVAWSVWEHLTGA